ncbi:hypothetical protein GINT2_000422 [Glugoides intestinalis]
MIQDKTQYFFKIKKTPAVPRQCLSIDNIKPKISSLKLCISQLDNKLEFSTLPGFSSKEKKYREITDLRSRIDELSKEIEHETRDFNCEDKIIADAVQKYLFARLTACLSRLRAFQQRALCQTEEIIRKPDFEFEMMQETIQRNNTIKASIFNLTNTLIQLKVALKSQTGIIDTIDSCFESSNMFLAQANKEIEKLPSRYCGFKDYIIYFELYIICILLSFIIIRLYSK